MLICPVVKCVPVSVQERSSTVMQKATRTSHIILKNFCVTLIMQTKIHTNLLEYLAIIGAAFHTFILQRLDSE